MKEQILKSIDDFVSTCYTFFKVSAGDFAKENFPIIVENVWDDEITDLDNYENIKKLFQTNAILLSHQNKDQAAKCIEIFLEGWFDKINI